MTTHLINACDNYISARTGKYEWRAARYRAACDWLLRDGIDDSMTVTDIGAGWTEFDYCLRAEYAFRGRYIPIDGGIDGTDLNDWAPARATDYYVALEIMEHLEDWPRLVRAMQATATRGITISTPNPRTTDVLGMDDTHVTEIHKEQLEALGFTVEETTFYGGVFSGGEPDALFATWSTPAPTPAGAHLSLVREQPVLLYAA